MDAFGSDLGRSLARRRRRQVRAARFDRGPARSCWRCACIRSS